MCSAIYEMGAECCWLQSRLDKAGLQMLSTKGSESPLQMPSSSPNPTDPTGAKEPSTKAPFTKEPSTKEPSTKEPSTKVPCASVE